MTLLKSMIFQEIKTTGKLLDEHFAVLAAWQIKQFPGETDPLS